MCLKLCKTKKVKIKDGRMIILRRPKMSDVNQLKDYINALIDEDAMIRINEKQTLKSERVWLTDLMRKIRKNKLHKFVAEYNGEIIGNVELRKQIGRESHVAIIGLSVKKEYRRLGVGTVLMKRILGIGKQDKEIKVIIIDVYADNKPAIKMYKKLGFKHAARLKNRVKYKGKLGDKLIMDFES